MVASLITKKTIVVAAKMARPGFKETNTQGKVPNVSSEGITERKEKKSLNGTDAMV